MPVPARLRSAFVGASSGPDAERFRPGAQDAHWTPSWAAGGRTWAIVTAWNPGGAPQSAGANARAAARLLRAWPGASRAVVNGAGAWAEDARLLSGVRLRDAAALGDRFGPAAVLFGVGRRAALVWTAGPVHVERVWVVPDVAYTGSP